MTEENQQLQNQLARAKAEAVHLRSKKGGDSEPDTPVSIQFPGLVRERMKRIGSYKLPGTPRGTPRQVIKIPTTPEEADEQSWGILKNPSETDSPRRNTDNHLSQERWREITQKLHEQVDVLQRQKHALRVELDKLTRDQQL